MTMKPKRPHIIFYRTWKALGKKPVSNDVEYIEVSEEPVKEPEKPVEKIPEKEAKEKLSGTIFE